MLFLNGVVMDNTPDYLSLFIHPDDHLAHYGTLGMKWGVRRAYKTLGNSSASSEKKAKAVTKIQRSQEKASAKLNKLDQKATKKISTAVKRKYGWGGGQKA